MILSNKQIGFTLRLVMFYGLLMIFYSIKHLCFGKCCTKILFIIIIIIVISFRGCNFMFLLITYCILILSSQMAEKPDRNILFFFKLFIYFTQLKQMVMNRKSHYDSLHSFTHLQVK